MFREVDVFIKFYVLLYADDTVILAESAADLQASLNALCQYAKQWDLKVNLSKTQIVICSKGRKTSPQDFFYDGHKVKVVDDYTYLGVIQNFNGNFKKAIDNQKLIATKALKSLLAKTRSLDLDIDTQFELFQRCVVTILIYGSEIWAYDKYNVKCLDVFYKGFFKTALRVFKCTRSSMVLSESGQPHLHDLLNQRIIGFWSKLRYDNVPRLSKYVLRLISHLNGQLIPLEDVKATDKCHPRFEFPWLETVKKTLDDLGLSDIWSGLNPVAQDPKYIVSQVKLRIRDARMQIWQAKVNSEGECSFYKSIKSDLQMPPYLHLLNPNLRIALSQFRLRSHHLPVNCNRFLRGNGTSSGRNVCTLCDRNAVGDEPHFLFDCSFFNDARKRFLPERYKIPNPSPSHAHQLFNEEDLDTLTRLAKFCKVIMKSFKLEKGFSPLKVRKTHVMASGRVSKRPKYLDEFFV